MHYSPVYGQMPSAAAVATGAPDINLHDTITAIDDASEFYPIDKLAAHVHNVPHVAISIFLFHGQRLLLQRRAKSKYHSGGLWANTVCSHPRWNETIQDCAKRRLTEELGIACDVAKFGEIRYEARVGELYENEKVHCLIGQLSGIQTDNSIARCINPLEVGEVAFHTFDEIEALMAQHPQRFTEWFKIYMGNYRSLISEALAEDVANTLNNPMTAAQADAQG